MENQQASVGAGNFEEKSFSGKFTKVPKALTIFNFYPKTANNSTVLKADNHVDTQVLQDVDKKSVFFQQPICYFNRFHNERLRRRLQKKRKCV